MSTELPIVGRLEKVHFNEFNPDGEDVIAKIDTGADTGALHVIYEKLVTDDEGKQWLEYQAIDETHNIIRTDKFERVTVVSSNGTDQDRYKIHTTLILRGQEYDIDLTLADRSEMTYEVIIGRKFLEGRFLVDVSQENI